MTQSEPEAIDEGSVFAFRACADQLQSAVRNSQNGKAEGATATIILALKKFFPDEISSFASENRSIQKQNDLNRSQIDWTSIANEGNEQDFHSSIEAFKQEITGSKGANAIKALGKSGILLGVIGPHSELRSLEVEVEHAGVTKRLQILPQMAKLALWTREISMAKSHASNALLLTMGNEASPLAGDAIHDSNSVLGQVALLNDDLAEAKRCLLESTRILESIRFRLAGPDMALANELLKKGERDAVVDFLQRCRSSWRSNRNPVENWIVQIMNGERPLFHLLQLTGGPSLPIPKRGRQLESVPTL